MQWHDKDTSSWENLKRFAEEWVVSGGGVVSAELDDVSVETEAGFVSYRSQIKQGIESAKQPTVEKTFSRNLK